ncbi:hypothetical protein GCM10018790_22000 [Kitasatospora xanthocidica]|nr:hypothetical protein GCM10018790_22000 [Kitasatospora xanthocidica]
MAGARDGADDHLPDKSYPMGKGSITFSESRRAGVRRRPRGARAGRRPFGPLWGALGGDAPNE